MATRAPVGPLRHFVRALWTSDAPGPARPLGSRREIALPSGEAHLALRLSDEPVRIGAATGAAVARAVATAVAAGPRTSPYIKDVSRPAATVGAQLWPGAVPALLGVPASELVDRHVALPLLWGPAADDLRDRLWAVRDDPARALDRLEAFLLARLSESRPIHPAVGAALAELERAGDVGRAVRASGYSHRHVIALFRDAVGTTPREYLQVRRFGGAVELLRGAPDRPLGEVAIASGFADQAHLGRAFRRHAGVTPGQYAAARPVRARHVPLEAPPARSNTFKTEGRSGGRVEPGDDG